MKIRVRLGYEGADRRARLARSCPPLIQYYQAFRPVARPPNQFRTRNFSSNRYIHDMPQNPLSHFMISDLSGSDVGIERKAVSTDCPRSVSKGTDSSGGITKRCGNRKEAVYPHG